VIKMAATGRTRNARLPSRLCIRPVVVAPPASIGKKDWASFASPKTASRPAPTRAETVTVIRQTATASETAPRPTAAEVTDDIAPALPWTYSLVALVRGSISGWIRWKPASTTRSNPAQAKVMAASTRVDRDTTADFDIRISLSNRGFLQLRKDHDITN